MELKNCFQLPGASYLKHKLALATLRSYSLPAVHCSTCP
jgi:hypothetical protein